MGTELYARGVALDVNFDELNVTRPDLVKSVHQDYVAAGAEFLETNTYGANRGRLQGYGLESCLTDINAAGVKLARDAADGKAFVAGSIGSLPSEEYSDDPIVWTPADVLGKSGIGECGDLGLGARAELLDDVQHIRNAATAVGADDVGAEFDQTLQRRIHVDAAHRDGAVLKSELRAHGQVSVILHGLNALLQLF